MNSRISVQILLLTLLAAGMLCLAMVVQATPSVLHAAGSADQPAIFLYRLSNAIIVLPSDPLGGLARVLQTPLSPEQVYAAHLFIFTLGTILLLLSRQSFYITAVLGISVGLLVHWNWGSDSILLRSICWLPWIDFILSSQSTKIPRRHQLIALVAISILHAQSAQFLAFAAVLFLLSLHWRPHATASPDAETASQKERWLLAAVLVLPALLVLDTSPILTVPDYPPLSHVVRDDGLPGTVQSVIGRDFPIQIFERDNVKQFFLPLAAVLTLGSLLLLAFNRERRLLGFSFVLALVALLDCWLPEQFAQILPVAVLARLLPGFLPYPLASLVTFFSLYLICRANCSFIMRSIVLCTALLAGALLVNFFPEQLGPQSPQLSQVKAILQSEQSELRNKLLSPSYFVLMSEGLHLVSAPAKGKLIPVSTLNCTARASSEIDMNKAFDGDPDTRWSSASSGQHQQEWFEISCISETVFTGIRLELGKWASDFPRGLRIRTSKACDDDWPITYQNSNWQGAVHHSEKGYPHYRGQDDITVYFDRAITAKCLRLEQIGQDTRFDWSIAELSLIQPNTKNSQWKK